MAKRKLQMTAFARFFLFLIIFVPALFFGVSYIKGEDGVQTLKDLVGMETTDSPSTTAPSSSADTEVYVNAEVKRLQDELDEKSKLLKEVYRENELLKKQTEDAKAELEEVKTQLEKIKSAIGQ